MPQLKTLSIDFYRVAIPDAAQLTFQELLSNVAGMAAPARNSEVRGRTLRLQSLAPWQGCIEGDFIRIRMDDIPQVADLDGSVDDLDIPASAGVGECAAFLYHEPTNVLVIQRNMHGASAGAFAGYFDNYSGINESILLEPIMREDEYRKLRRLSHPKKFEVKIANAHDIRLREMSTTDYSRLAARHGAETMHINIGSGRSRSTWLNLNNVRDDVQRFFGISRETDGQTITVLKISGYGAGDEVIALDLLRGRLKYQQKISGELRTIPYETRRAVVRTAFNENSAALVRMFGEATVS